MASTSPSDLRVRLLRDFAALAFLQAAGSLVVLFLILRVVAPWLVSRHDDLALWAAGGLLLLCPLIVLQAVYVLWRTGRRLRRRLGAFASL